MRLKNNHKRKQDKEQAEKVIGLKNKKKYWLKSTQTRKKRAKEQAAKMDLKNKQKDEPK